VFRSTADLYIYLQAYEPDAATARPLIAYVSFFRDGVKLFETPLTLATGGLNPKSHMLPIQLTTAEQPEAGRIRL
jgi:hypothetical protein